MESEIVSGPTPTPSSPEAEAPTPGTVYLRYGRLTVDRTLNMVVLHYTVMIVGGGKTRVEQRKGAWNNFNLMAEQLDAELD